MTWTPPATWSGSLVTVAAMNTQVRDNLLALKDPPGVFAVPGAFTTSSTTPVDIPGASGTISTNGGAVFVGAAGYMFQFGSGNDAVVFLQVDGGVNVIVARAQSHGSPVYNSIAINAAATGLAAGSHSFKLRCNVNLGSAQFVVSGFFIREIS